MPRRLLIALLAALLAGCGAQDLPPACRQATGVKVGEVTSSSAVIWTRVTASSQRREDGQVFRGRADRDEANLTLDPRELEGSAPGAPGRVRVRYGLDEDLEKGQVTPWAEVRADDDYTHQFRLEGLQPDSVYHYRTETAAIEEERRDEPLEGRFKTAPLPGEYNDVTFTVITGQAYRDADDEDGFKIYRSMLKLEPEFLVPTGDTVYYDSDAPLVTGLGLARYHWCRMYSYPALVRFHLRTPGYWMKDDHDSYANDNWPGLVRDYMGNFSFEKGLKVFAEQTPTSDKPYRTFRWGKGLQIWLVEGRDFRSPNTAPDGPEKTIWGEEQKQWLTKTLLESDADWRILISPTPIVGPDRSNKADNHANPAFSHEGDWFRRWAAENLGDNFFIICGDRHWQYHSTHPETGLQEFSSGPASDAHAGGTPGEMEDFHQFHRVGGGFLSVNTKKVGDKSVIVFRFHEVDGEVVYQWVQGRQAAGSVAERRSERQPSPAPAQRNAVASLISNWAATFQGRGGSSYALAAP